MKDKQSQLTLKYLGINTYKEPIIYMRSDCRICKSVRSFVRAEYLKKFLKSVAKEYGIETNVILSDGSQQIGRGIGPVLEALIELLTPLHSIVSKSQPLFKLYAETPGELHYALDFLNQGHEIFQIEVSS